MGYNSVYFIPMSKFLRKDANGEKAEQKIHPNNYSGDCQAQCIAHIKCTSFLSELEAALEGL